ncbi:phosphatase PAP2 family protein [Candidatus Sumerlaeota bacterium]|nr:phosphatase PAP2 family protein [Candidatus Sumerlaeota bacterium]MBI3736721.1 phosphatase PAP2 family protein [Candidatus Sumerlaeota bacterium]
MNPQGYHAQEQCGDRPFIAWPGLRQLAGTQSLSAAYGAIFLLVYGGADILTDHYAHRGAIYFGFEPAIPFVPPMVLAYLSINVLLGIAPFVFRRWDEMMPLFLALTAETVLAGFLFLVLPLRCVYPEPTLSGVWGMLYRVADAVNLRHNEFPSLHVALTVTAAWAYGTRCKTTGQTLLSLWAGSIVASTVLIHAHHLVDVAGGLALALGGMIVVYPRASRLLDRLVAEAKAQPQRPGFVGSGVKDKIEVLSHRKEEVELTE